MKKIKELGINVTYSVSFTDIEVSDEIYNAIMESFDRSLYATINPCLVTKKNEIIVADWLSDNVSEADAYDWEAKIEID